MIQNIHDLIHDDRGLSPVIAVLLLIGITLILGAVIGAFVMGVTGGFAESAPDASINFDYDEDGNSVTIEHASGKLLMEDNTGMMRVSGSATADASGGEWNSNHFDHDGEEHDSTEAQLTDTIEVSHTIWSTTYSEADAEIESGDDIQLIWISPDGSESGTLGQFEAP